MEISDIKELDEIEGSMGETKLNISLELKAAEGYYFRKCNIY